MSLAGTQDAQRTETEPYPAEAGSLTVLGDGRGSAWAVWEAETASDVDLHFSLWAGSSWSAPQPVRGGPATWDRGPDLALDSDGTAWLAWSSVEKTDPDGSRLYISRWNGRGWTEPEAVPTGTASKASEPSLAAGPDGSMWLAWVGFDGMDDEIFASHWDGASWSQPQQVSAQDQDPALYDRQPRITVAGPREPTGTGPRYSTAAQDDLPWLVWTGHEAGPDDEIFASHWTGSSWTSEQMVSQDDDALDSEPTLVLDRDGQPWAAWKGRVQAEQDSRLRILVSRWDPSRYEWSPEAVASSPLDWDVDEKHPHLFLDEQGTTRLAWVAYHDPESVIAHAELDRGVWSQPQVLHTGKADFTPVPYTTTGSGAPLVAWLNPTMESQGPLQWREIKGEAGARESAGARSLSAWLQATASRMPASMLVDPVPNRYLAFGDSITYGGYADFSYPVRLETKLDLRVANSDVVNAGNRGEGTYGGSERLWQEIKAEEPKYVLVMEGTNDVTDRSEPADVYDNLLVMIDRARNESGVDGFQIMLATLVPRLDDENDATYEMNQQAIIPAAANRGIPVCDQWQAFYNFGPWNLLYRDMKHPNDDGLQLISDTFYNCMLAFFPDVEEETTPPTTWIASLPAHSECGQIPVAWDGSDNLNWVVDYDVQASTSGGPWTDWLDRTASTGGTYPGGRYNDTVEFRVRGRDLIGNLGSYSPSASTQVTIDNDPPYDAGVRPLPPVQAAPFPVSWWGMDACADVTSYAVEFKVGVSGEWQKWLPETTSTVADFSPASPDPGETYYFHVRPRDEALNWGSWSDPDATFTVLARHAIRGQALNVRHQAVALPDVTVSPTPIFSEYHSGGGFSVYVDASGDYDMEVNKTALYGTLPPMQDLPVNDTVTGLEFVLPPHDDAVANGGFETGTLGSWQPGGSLEPQWTAISHTGTGAVQLAGGSGASYLSQIVSPGSAPSDPTLSFMVRLAVAGASSLLDVQLSDSDPGSPDLTDSLTVGPGEWTHVWYDLSGRTPPFTLTFGVTNDPAVYIDEVSLGSAIQGQFWAHLPIIRR